MEKAPVSVACGGESPLDGICLSESDKTAVLTLIREEVKACLFHPLVTPLLCTAPVPAGRSHLWRPELPNPGWQFTRPAARAAPIKVPCKVPRWCWGPDIVVSGKKLEFCILLYLALKCPILPTLSTYVSKSLPSFYRGYVLIHKNFLNSRLAVI